MYPTPSVIAYNTTGMMHLKISARIVGAQKDAAWWHCNTVTRWHYNTVTGIHSYFPSALCSQLTAL